MRLSNLPSNATMKLGIGMFIVFIGTWGLYWTYYCLNTQLSTPQTNRSKYATKLHILSNNKRTIPSEAIPLLVVSNNETTKHTDSKPQVKVPLQDVPTSGKESLPVHVKGENIAEIRMKSEDNESHYFTLHKTRINPIDVDFIINGAQICGTGAKYMTLLILVPSLPSHSTIRGAIRSTYGSYAKHRFSLQNSSIEVTVRLAFLVGKDGTTHSDKIVRSESKRHGDIIYINFVESYRKLTRKMLIALKWVSVYCSDLSFLLKVDEDVFVNIPLLAEQLHKHPYDIKGSIYGHLYLTSYVRRKGKWAVSKKKYPLPFYPTYAAGIAYVISGNIIPRMFILSEYVPHMSIEDAFITGFIAKIVQAKQVFIPGFAFYPEEEIGPCKFMDVQRISVTNVTVDKMLMLWNTSLNYTNVC